MSQQFYRRLLLLLPAILACILVSGLAVWPQLVSAVASDPVTAAWEKARAAGSYHFDSDVIQATIPSPKLTNIGRNSRTETLHLSGQTDLRQQSLEMQLWSEGGSVLQNESGLAVKVEQGKSYVRRQGPAGWEEWQEVESGIDGFAPQGDFLAYLVAVRDIQAHVPETRTLPDRTITFTRYTFTIDGPAFAAFMRDQVAQALREKGELPPGVQLQTAEYYRQMRGDGELWVREDGLPLRQILNLTFPEQEDEFISAQITVDFSGFGRPQTSLTELARARDLAGLVAALPTALPDPAPLLMSVFLLAFVILILHYRRARPVQIAVATAVITSLVIGPLLSTFKVDAFFAAQAAKAAAQDGQRTDSDMERSLRSLGDRPEFNPQVNPLESVNSGAWESVTQSPPHLVSTAALQATDNGLDTDNDGLSDFVEARVGTDPNIADTDEDGLPDALEVRGFTYAGKQWYTDPLALDSNNDGVPDETEWGRNADGTRRSTPLDTDNDGVPDLFDADNDNDGVPDRQDLSPFTKGTSTANEAAPFKLTIKNLTAGRPAFVDFQLRPTEQKHLWFAFNVLDWPRNDNQGQVIDIDGGTYASLADAEGRTAAANESYGDMKLLPMLEIRLPANGANLPPQSELTPYNITVNNLTEDGSQQVAYAPLSLVIDEQTGQRVAFTGRMRYLPTGNWPAAHEIRLAWVVQALVDLACDHNDPQAKAAGCESDGYIHNVPQVVQSYYDDWTLTGLNISEQHGATTAILYEDPALDNNVKDDIALVSLTHALEQTFLEARDQDGDGKRDVTIENIAQNLNTLTINWEIPNILQVESASYATFDQAAMYMAMTETVALLGNVFDPVWSTDPTLMPTLLYAYEQNSRGMGLDTMAQDHFYVNLDLNNLHVDFQPSSQPAVEKMTVAGLKWAHYCREQQSAVWEVCAAEVYWEEMQRRYGNAVLPGDPVGGDLAADVQAGRVATTQLYALALSHGVNNIVQRGNTLIAARYALKDDPAIANTVRAALGLSTIAVVFLVNMAVYAAMFDTSVVTEIGKWARNIGQNTLGNAKDFGSWVTKNGKFNKGASQFVLKMVVVLGVFTAIGIAAAGGGNQDTKIALRAMALGLQIFLSLIDPVLTFTRMAKAGITLAYSSEFIGVTRGGLVIGTVIAIAVVWGFFIYSMAANNVTPFSPAFNRALAETIAATIYLILLALISMTIVGLLLVGIVAVIDAILTAICELGVDDLRKVPGLGGACFTLGTTAIKAIAYALYNYDVMVDPDRRDMVSPGSPQTQLADPAKGFVEGNELSITMPITTNIVHKSPDAANGLMINLYLYFFSASNLRSTTFKYSLTQPDEQDLSASRGTMRSEWQNVREHHKYAATPMYGGYATTTPAAVRFNLKAGINRPTPYYLNMGYALPAYECWYIYTPWPAPVCYTRTFSGKSSTKIETLHYDIFPATFTEFISVAARPDGGLGLAWDSRFPSLVDADGDGLRSPVHGGIDPTDNPDAHGWDTDNDGLTDFFEMERRQAGIPFSPIQCDTDGDGLTDAQEAFYGTNPAIADSDNDGLKDGEEVWHQDHDPFTCELTDNWLGGWEVTINAATPFNIRVTSDPMRHDSDGDGISDLAEYQLAHHPDPAKRMDEQNRPYHPHIFNTAPIALHLVTDRQFVRPGDSLTYTTTAVASVALAPSMLDVTLPGSPSGPLGASPAPALLNFDPLTFSDSQTVTHQLVLTAQPGLNTQTMAITSSVRARLAPTGTPGWAWDTIAPQPIDTLPSDGPWPIYNAVSPARPDRLDDYVLSMISSDTGPTLRGANGAVRTYGIPGGESAVIETGNNNQTARRGLGEPGLACNDTGQCMVVWEQRKICNTITIHHLFVTREADHSGGSEPVIYFIADRWDTDPRDGGYELLWNPFDAVNNGEGLRDGDQRGPDANGFPIVKEFCAPGRIDIYEADTDTVSEDTTQTNWDEMDFVASSQIFDADDFVHPAGTWSFTSPDNNSEYVLNVTIPHKNLDTIRGALVGPTGQEEQPSFEFPSLLPLEQSIAHSYHPVVASDGVNFLVVSELATETPARTYLAIQQFNGEGDSLGGKLYTLEDPRPTPVDNNSLTFALAWIGDRYRLALKYQARSGQSKIDHIYVANINRATNDLMAEPSGQHLALATTFGFGSSAWPPSLAYDPHTDRTLLAYSNAGNTAHAMLYQGKALSSVLVAPKSLINAGSSVKAAYHATINAWLISIDGTVQVWQPDLAATLLPPGNGAGNTLACPMPYAAPVVDLRFEETPGATAFRDSSALGNHATCSGSLCPDAGGAGAVDALGNAVGGSPVGVASDYALVFDGNEKRFQVATSPINFEQDNFTIAFWYRSQPNRPGAFRMDMSQSRVVIVALHNNHLAFQAGTKQLVTANNVVNNVNDGQWHFVVATHDAASGQPTLYLDGAVVPVTVNTGTSAFNPANTLSVYSTARHQLDQLQVYRAALSADVVRDLYDRTMQSYCVAGSFGIHAIQWEKLRIAETDPRGGKITASNGLNITIDGDAPTSSIGGLSNGQYILGNTVHTIGGNADDATSGVARLEMNINNGGWQTANGAATWAYNLAVGEGSYTIQSRATDVAGNVETPGSGITVVADATPPNITFNALPEAPVRPTRNASGRWSVTVSGAASDPASGGQPGSGLQAGSVEVLLVGQAGDEDAQGNGWQQAVLNGNTWTIAYTFAEGLLDPTGTYTVHVRASDSVGNRTADGAVTATLHLDNTGPAASMSQASSARLVISDTLTISGIISDTGAAGVDALEAAFTPVEQIAALPSDVTADEAQAALDAAGRTWLPATLAQRGAGVRSSEWSLAVPVGLEGEYQIDLRGADVLGNRRITANVWRGVIDTLAPRVAIRATATGASYFDDSSNTELYAVTYLCGAVDRHLQETGFTCPGGPTHPPTRSFENNPVLEALFPDRTIRNGLAISYTVWEDTVQPIVTASACDGFGHCASVTTPGTMTSSQSEVSAAGVSAGRGGAPVAVVVAPTHLSYVAANGASAISVTVAAEAGQTLKTVALMLDGVDVATLNFAQNDAITHDLRTISVAVAGDGPHTLTARAIDWAGVTQTTLFPVTFTLDTQLPAATIDTSTLTISDTWQLKSGVLRFRGTASDNVGLAAVQIRVEDQPFTDVTFGNGVWRTALHVQDPEGKTLAVTVRAFDYAGQMREVSGEIPTDLSAPDAPDTAITAGPANPSDAPTASFEFTGTPGGREVAAFDCRLDDGPYLPCTSPWTYSDLNKGEHIFNVRAIDAGGFVDLSPASWSWTVKAGLVDATITSGPANPTSERSASFTFTGSGAASFECSLDSAAFTVCTSPQHYSNLADGEHTFQVRGKDNAGQVGPAERYTWTIINAAPVAHDQTVTTPEDTPIAITLTASDVDALTYHLISQPARGKVLGAPPNVTYSPDPDANGVDSFRFRANDGVANSNEATVTINVTPVNDPPVAHNQTIRVSGQQPTAFTLAASDVDGDPLSYTVVSPLRHGRLSGSAPDLTYTAEAGFVGEDSFSYEVSDGNGGTAAATVTLVVTAAGQAGEIWIYLPLVRQ